MKALYWITKRFFEGFFYTFYRLKVHGRDHLNIGAALLASNHASYYDSPLLMAAAPHELSFLAVHTLFKKPILNSLITNLNAHPIAGMNVDRHSFKTISKLLGHGSQIVIFPEGTRAVVDDLKPLKAGVVVLALQCQAPIIPVYIHGSLQAWPRTRLFPKPWGKIDCVFGSPIDWRPYAKLPRKEGREAFLAHLAEKMKGLKLWYEAGAQGSPP